MNRGWLGAGVALVAGLMTATPSSGQSSFVWRGRAIAGGVLFGHVAPGSNVRCEGRRLRVTDRGVFVLGIAPEPASELECVVRGPEGRRELVTRRVELRRYASVRVDGVDPALVRPRGGLGRRQRDGDRELFALRSRDSPAPYFTSGFEWPVEGPRTGGFAEHRSFGAQHGFRHWGIDIAAPLGRVVRAPAAGRVAFVQELPVQGRMVVLDHGHGLTSSLLHLSAFRVHEGDLVQRGAPVGLVGSSGRATGAHLDWRMHALGTPVDPHEVVRAAGEGASVGP